MCEESIWYMYLLKKQTQEIVELYVFLSNTSC